LPETTKKIHTMQKLVLQMKEALHIFSEKDMVSPFTRRFFYVIL